MAPIVTVCISLECITTWYRSAVNVRLFELQYALCGRLCFSLVLCTYCECRWVVDVTGVPGTLYDGEQFKLQFKFGTRYPFDSPTVCLLLLSAVFFLSSSVEFCYWPGFWHPSSVSPSFCVFCCSFKSRHVAFEFFSSFFGLPAIWPSIISCERPAVRSQNVINSSLNQLNLASCTGA